MMKKNNWLFPALFLFCVSCNKNPQPEQPSAYKIATLEGITLLGEVTYQEYDADRTRDAILRLHEIMDEIIEEWGLCSSFRHGQFQVRNLDWFMQDQANFPMTTFVWSYANDFSFGLKI